jgi:DNA-binding NtrC family response regulator
MGKKVILISKQSKDTDLIIDKLSDNQYSPHLSNSIEGLGKNIIETKCNCVILDLDSISIDNQTIREFTIHYPHVYFLCMSKDRFHPELKDAICYHIYACLIKPLDHDELLYWLRCIDDNDLDLDPAIK